MYIRLKIFFSLSIGFILSSSPVTAQTSGTELYHPFSASERPQYSDNLPEFVKMTLLPNPNFHAVEAAFEAYEKAEKAKIQAKTEEKLEVEDKYDVYFKRWKKAYQPFAQADGSIVLPTRADYKRMIQTDNLNRSRQLSPLSSGANWTVVGPLETYLPKWLDDTQPAISWHVNTQAFDIFKGNTNILYVAPQSGGIFKTVDKGLNWTICAPNFNFGEDGTTIEIHPTNPDIVYVGMNAFLYKSTDGGNTWTDLSNCPSDDPNDIAISPTNPNIVLVAAENGLFRSTDGGSTWATIYTQPCYDIEFKANNPTHVFILKSNGTNVEFLKSTDTGESFAVKSTGTTQLRAGRLAVSAADANRIYMLCEGEPNPPRLYKSLDAGETWTDMNGLFCTIGISDAEGGQGYRDLDITASQTDANQIVYGICSIVKAVSTDNGATFSYAHIGGYCAAWKIHPDLQEVKCVMNGSQLETWMATDGGMTFSTDFFATDRQHRSKGIYVSDFWGFGQGWNDDLMVGGRFHNGNTALADIYTDGKALFIGGSERGTGYVLHGQERTAVFSDSKDFVLPTTLTGNDYKEIIYSKLPNEMNSGFDASSLIIHPYYSTHHYIGEGNAIWKTTDNGVTFVSLHDFGSLVYRIDMSRSNPLVLYLAAANGFYKTTDGGNTWATITVPSGRNPQYAYIAINPTNHQDVWITFKNEQNSTASAKVYQTTDGGTTWTDKTTSTLNTYKIKYIVHTGGGIYISTNANERLSPSITSLHDKVFYRAISATDWTDYSSGLLPMLRIVGMKPFYRDGKLRIAGNQGIWETPLAEVVAPIAMPIVDKQSSDCMKNIFQFDDYSILNHSGATWLWSFSPTPQYVSSTTVRNPKVIFGAAGTYSVTLTVSNSVGNSTRSVTNMVTLSGTACSIDTTPSLAASLTGSGSDYILSEKAFPSNNDDFSISFWIKSSDEATAPRTILGTRNVSNSQSNTGQGWAFVLRRSATNDELHFELGDGSNVKRVKTNFDITDNVWHHVAGTVNNAGNMEFFVDGVSMGTQSVSSLGTISNGVQLHFGKDYNEGQTAYPYSGQIEEVKIWNTPLSINDIREKRHLTAYLAQEPNLVGYYQFVIPPNPFSHRIAFSKMGTSYTNRADSSTKIPISSIAI